MLHFRFCSIVNGKKRDKHVRFFAEGGGDGMGDEEGDVVAGPVIPYGWSNSEIIKTNFRPRPFFRPVGRNSK